MRFRQKVKENYKKKVNVTETKTENGISNVKGSAWYFEGII